MSRETMKIIQSQMRQKRMSELHAESAPLKRPSYVTSEELDAVKDTLANTEAYLNEMIERVNHKAGQIEVRLPVQRSVSIPVTVDQGGTAATTATQARVNLGIGTDANTINLGDPTTDGSWRIAISSANLVIEKRESGSWVEKASFLP